MQAIAAEVNRSQEAKTENRLQAVEAVNAPAEFMGGRAMIGRKKCVAAADLSNLSLSMQHLAA